MKKRINPLVFDLSIDSKIVDKFTIARKEVERTIQNNKMDWNEKNLIKEVERLKAKINNKTAYTKSIEKKAYNLSVENEFLKNRIAIIESKKGFEVEKIKSLTKDERVELLEKIRAFKGSVVSFIDSSKNNKKEEKKEVELIKGKWYFCHDVCFRYKHTEVGNFDNKIHFLSLFDDVNIYNGYYFFENKDWEIIEATTEQVKKGITLERDNGYFWNDEKQDFLKLEDVYFIAKRMIDFAETYEDKEVCNLRLNEGGVKTGIMFNCFYDSNDFGKFLFFYNGEFCNSCILVHDYERIEVTKEVFIKLLKNYKG